MKCMHACVCMCRCACVCVRDCLFVSARLSVWLAVCLTLSVLWEFLCSSFRLTYPYSMFPHVLHPPIPSLHLAGKHTASSHGLSALVTPAGHSYVCEAKQTLTLISSDHQKGVTVAMSDIQIQPFDINSDFIFSEGTRSSHDIIPAMFSEGIAQQPTVVLLSWQMLQNQQMSHPCQMYSPV